jgi:hypothetical protein
MRVVGKSPHPKETFAMPPASPPRAARLDMRLRPALRQRIARIAQGENRTVSTWVELVVETAVAEHARRNAIAR